MPPIKRAKPSPALIVAVVALVAGLAGTAVGGATISALNQQERKQVRNIAKKQAKKQAKKAVNGIPAGPRGETGPRGSTGPQGPAGEAGEDAVRLFAYIRDNGGANAASVDYGNGVTGVTDPGGSGGTYVVTFDRDLSGCVVHVTSGVGIPASGNASSVNNSTPYVNLDPNGEVQVRLYNASNLTVDTSFLISAVC